MQKLPHCESFYRALDKKLEQKMTINDIASELCSHTKDPRRNMIIDIKEYKGEDWLVANADWLGYDLGHAFAGRQTQEQAKRAAIRCSNDLSRNKANVCDNDMQKDILTTINAVVSDTGKEVKEKSKYEEKIIVMKYNKENIEFCEKEYNNPIVRLLISNRERESDDEGLYMYGYLINEIGPITIRHDCWIYPSLPGFYYVTIFTTVENDGEEIGCVMSWNKLDWVYYMIGCVIDNLLYDGFYKQKEKNKDKEKCDKKYCKIPRYSENPDWKWPFCFSMNRKESLEMVDRYMCEHIVKQDENDQLVA